MTSPTRSDSLPTPEAPTHHIHHSSDPVRGQTPQDKPEPCQQISSTAAGGEHHDKQRRPEKQADQGHPETQPDPASGETRPGDIKSKASITDRFIGKAEKLVGKIKKSPELEERGRLRESEGKTAVVKDTKPT